MRKQLTQRLLGATTQLKELTGTATQLIADGGTFNNIKMTSERPTDGPVMIPNGELLTLVTEAGKYDVIMVCGPNSHLVSRARSSFINRVSGF